MYYCNWTIGKIEDYNEFEELWEEDSRRTINPKGSDPYFGTA